MNAPLNFDTLPPGAPGRDGRRNTVGKTRGAWSTLRRLRDATRLKRTSFRGLSFWRLLRGGRLNDAGRLPRYVLVIGVVLASVWVPIITYLKVAAPSYTSSVSLILPGTGVSSSVSLSEIGQASTSANSPYASSSVSPTVTYQKLVQSRRVISIAARDAKIDEAQFGQPRVKLVDQTSLMEIQMKGGTPEEARLKTEAVLAAFLTELKVLRDDEIQRREDSVTGTVRKYKDSVDTIRDEISSLQITTGLNSTDQYDGIVERNEQLMSAIADGQAQLELVKNSVSSLSALLEIAPEAASKTIKLHADPEYGAHSVALSEAGAKLAELGNLYGARHPEVVDAQTRVNGLRSKMLGRAMQVTGLDAETLERGLDRTAIGERGVLLSQLVSEVAKRDGLVAQLASLGEKLAVNKARLVELSDTASRLERLNRDYKVAEAVFTSALARLNVSKTDVFASYPMVQIAEPPSLPWAPSSPNKMLAIAAGVMATLCTLVGLVLIWVRRPVIDLLTGARRKSGGTPNEAA
ncbi:hypothetical protein [Oricola sp.]|uniref:GumC family protein n=1 Tax=Oricola sp. TaxID=1979950 RepID=UPI0025D33738|nr:hypothetical protein [Oricola sp.]MCI5078616.1 hypothetical protein [Oricola sp.]